MGKLVSLRHPDGPRPQAGVVAEIEEDFEASRPSGVRLPESDETLVAWLRAKDPRGGDLLVTRYASQVERVLFRVLGRQDDLDDLAHEVFIAVLQGIGGLRDVATFRGWLTRIAVFTARTHIRKRRRKWWLVFSDEVPEQSVATPEHEMSEAARATYAVLERMDPDDRIPFALRRIDGMELTEVAEACDVSLATIKRRLARAEARFLELAGREPSLASWTAAATTRAATRSPQGAGGGA